MDPKTWPITLELLGWQAKILAVGVPEEHRETFTRFMHLLEEGIKETMRIEEESRRDNQRLDELNALKNSGRLTVAQLLAAPGEAQLIVQRCDANQAALARILPPIQTEWNRLGKLAGAPDLHWGPEQG